MSRLLTSVLLLITIPACGGGGTTATGCTQDRVAGISVTLIDAITSNPISGGTLIITEGSYKEVLQSPFPGLYQGAHERKGLYTLSVAVPTYVSKTVTNIQVNKGDCHVTTNLLQFALSKAANATYTDPGLVIVEMADGQVEVRHAEFRFLPLDR